MIRGLWPTLILFGPAVGVGVLFAKTGNDGAAALMSAGVFLLTIAVIRWTTQEGKE